MDNLIDRKIAVLIPCYNEGLTIGEVITDLRNALPEATVFVFDNNSTDRTPEMAHSLDAIVVKEKRQGKGFVVQSMFRKIDADIYVMVDGDDTCDISMVNGMIDYRERPVGSISKK